MSHETLNGILENTGDYIVMIRSHLFNDRAQMPSHATHQADLAHIGVDAHHITLPEGLDATIGKLLCITQLKVTSQEGCQSGEITVGTRHLIDVTDGLLRGYRAEVVFESFVHNRWQLTFEIIAQQMSSEPGTAAFIAQDIAQSRHWRQLISGWLVKAGYGTCAENAGDEWAVFCQRAAIIGQSPSSAHKVRADCNLRQGSEMPAQCLLNHCNAFATATRAIEVETVRLHWPYDCQHLPQCLCHLVGRDIERIETLCHSRVYMLGLAGFLLYQGPSSLGGATVCYQSFH